MGGDVRPTSKTLTLFMTKIYDFPYTIYDLTKKIGSDSLFMPFAAGTIDLNIVYEGVLLIVLSIKIHEIEASGGGAVSDPL